MTDMATVSTEHRSAGAPAPRPAPKFEKPAPGSWSFDAEHCERPHSRWLADQFAPVYTAGFRAGMERYGALLDTIECAFVNGWTYICVRPLGAPPEPKGTPPRPVFWLLTRLHPVLRKRIKRCEEVFETKLWREDVRIFFEEIWPRTIARYEAFQALRLEELDDEALASHLEDVKAMMHEGMFDHFLRATASMLPVGDYMVHAMEWTGCTCEEALALLNGCSPYSVEVVAELDSVADALRGDEEAVRSLRSDEDGGAILERLRARPGAVGEAVTRWLDRVGQRVVTGHDVAELRGIEMPGVLVSTLRAHLDRQPEDERARVEEATAALRARVPAPHRASFDELLEEARHVFPLRDGHSVLDFWGLDPERSTRFWGHAIDYLRTGRTIVGDTRESRGAAYRESTADLGRMLAAEAAELAVQLARRLADRPAPRVLDVGAGSGIWSLSLLERVPEARAVALDLPPVLPRFLELADAKGLGERVDVWGGDYLEVDPPREPFDVVILANVVHLETPERAARLLAHCARSVARGGLMVVVDVLKDGTPELDRAHACYALHLGMRVPGAYPHEEPTIRRWLADAGLAVTERIDLGTAFRGLAALLAHRRFKRDSPF